MTETRKEIIGLIEPYMEKIFNVIDEYLTNDLQNAEFIKEEIKKIISSE